MIYLLNSCNTFFAIQYTVKMCMRRTKIFLAWQVHSHRCCLIARLYCVWNINVYTTAKIFFSSLKTQHIIYTSFFLKESISFWYSLSFSSNAETRLLTSSSTWSRLLRILVWLSSNTVLIVSGQWNTVVFNFISSTIIKTRTNLMTYNYDIHNLNHNDQWHFTKIPCHSP